MSQLLLQSTLSTFRTKHRLMANRCSFFSNLSSMSSGLYSTSSEFYRLHRNILTFGISLTLLGREVVRRWLSILDRKLDRVDDAIDHNQYKDLVEWSSEKAFLPERTNFLGCKGSLKKYHCLSVHRPKRV